MKNYMISIERTDRCETYRYLRFKCQGANIYKALETAKLKTERLSLEINIKYEITKVEKI